MCIHHVSIAVASLQDAKKFYLAALAPLGYTEFMAFEHTVGLAANGKPYFWIRSLKEGEAPTKGVHIAFAAENQQKVDEVHAAALKAGATDNGAPGLRDYTPTYYAAFFIDPQGNNIEVVNMDQCQGRVSTYV